VLILTTPNGDTVTAATDVELASKWLDKQYGNDWATGLIPLDEHDAMFSTIEELDLMRSGLIDGYAVTEPTTFDH